MRVRSISIDVKDMDRMTRFWSEGFGVDFREVVTRGRGGMFGTLPDGTTLKLIDAAHREARDRDVLTLGVAVPDVEAVATLAEQLGGSLEGDLLRNGDLCHARIRDPDGNLLELYTG